MRRCSSLEVRPFESKEVSQSRHREARAICAKFTFDPAMTGPTIDRDITIVAYVCAAVGAVVGLEVAGVEVGAPWPVAVHPAARSAVAASDTSNFPMTCRRYDPEARFPVSADPQFRSSQMHTHGGM